MEVNVKLRWDEDSISLSMSTWSANSFRILDTYIFWKYTESLNTYWVPPRCGDALISWKCEKQDFVSKSSTEDYLVM
ncbi:hypothetical protein CR513_39009, partial [Mucuna pruriens]